MRRKILATAVLAAGLVGCGTLVWEVRYENNERPVAAPSDMVTDAAGNMYVTGANAAQGDGAEQDLFVVKYSADGKKLWEVRYDSPFETTNALYPMHDKGNAIRLDSQGNVIVAGISSGEGAGYSNYDWVVLKISPAGQVLWTSRLAGPAKAGDVARGLAVDANNNIYVTGSMQFTEGFYTTQVHTVSFSPLGAIRWQQSLPFATGGFSQGESVALDSDGSVVVGGSDGTDAVLAKYGNDGVSQWVQHFDGSDKLSDMLYQVAIDPATHRIFAVGTQFGYSGHDYLHGNDGLVLGVSGSGQQLWRVDYNGPDNSEDRGGNIVFGNNSLYATMETNRTGDNLRPDVATLKLDPATGAQQFVQVYDGGTNAIDRPADLYLDGQGYVHTVLNTQNTVWGYPTETTVAFAGTDITYRADGSTLNTLSQSSAQLIRGRFTSGNYYFAGFKGNPLTLTLWKYKAN